MHHSLYMSKVHEIRSASTLRYLKLSKWTPQQSTPSTVSAPAMVSAPATAPVPFLYGEIVCKHPRRLLLH